MGAVLEFAYDVEEHKWTWLCDGTNGANDTECFATEDYCGDGEKNGQEACDGSDGVGEADGCNSSCQLMYNGICGSAHGTIYTAPNSLLDSDPALCAE